jgi:molybdate transport system substrate-binding protein
MFSRFRVLVAVLLAAALAAPLPAAAKPANAPIVVFAAASMKNALDAMAAAWKAHTGKDVSIAYGSSAALARQIEYGAPADIFVSADETWMNYLEKNKLIQNNSRRDLFGNALVLIEPADSNISLKIAPGFDLAGATGNGKIAVCAIDSCPGGVYAKQALEKLDVFVKVAPKLAQADNIRNALMLVSRGEAKFGIVYATDAKADSKVKVVDVFPETSHAPIIYPAALVVTSKHPDAAAFLDSLSSPAAGKIAKGEGFTVLSEVAGK